MSNPFRMSDNNSKDVAYKLMHGECTEDIEVEANAEGSSFDGQQKHKGKEEGNTGVEVVLKKPLSSDTSTTSGVNGSGAYANQNSNRLQQENIQLENGIRHEDKLSNPKGIMTNDLLAKKLINHKSKIHQLASKGDIDKCLQLLKQPDVDLNVKGKHGMTALHHAAQNGHETLLNELLRLGANRYIKDLDNNLPVHFAARHGHSNCVKELINKCPRDDQQLNDKTCKGRTALMEAAELGSHDSCKNLVGLDVDEVDKQGNAALHLAVKGSFKMTAKFLLESGAKPTLKNESGITPLHEAARLTTRNCLELLYDIAEPEVFQVDKKGKNILHHAVTQKSADCLKYLLEKEHVNSNIKKCADSSIGTPLLHAMNCRTFACINALLDAGASPNVGCNGTYPIHKAARHGFHLVCDKILNMNISLLDLRNEHNQTPLHMAALSGHLETVDLICNRMRFAQICPSHEDDLGQTALHMAVKKSNENILKRLINGNITLGKQDSKGFTALHLAAQMGKMKCCELLVERARANLNKFCKSGYFPLDLALQNMEKSEETALYLLRVSSFECKNSDPKQKNSAYLDNVRLLKRRMRKYMEKALDKKLRDIANAILDSTFWEDSLFVGKNLKPENFKKLVTTFPELAFKAQGKCIKSKSGDETVYGFALFEDNYYMEEKEEDPFDEKTGKVKAAALEHHTDVYSWAENHSVNLMISNDECELLKHPVTKAWLKHKWHSYIRMIHRTLLALEWFYLFSLIFLMATSWNWIHISHTFGITKEEFCETASQLYQNAEDPSSSMLINANVTEVIRKFEETVNPYRVFYYWVTLNWVIKLILEIFYIARLRHLYLSPAMLPHAVIEISQLILTMVLIFSPLGMCYQERPGLLQEDLAWQCGIFAVLFAWMHFINSINQALTSVYLPIIKDFLEILVKVAYFVVTFVLIFAFIFHLLLLEKNAFASIWQSLGTTLVWMLIDLGYHDTFVEEKLSYPILSNILFFVFITTIGCLILSLISKERTVKSKGKELDPQYLRFVIYTQLLFRYDICFPWFRQWFAVNKYVDSRKQQTILEYYLGEIENAESEEVTQDYREIVEQGKKLESMISDLSDQVTSIKLQLTKITHKESGLGDDHQ